MDGLRIERVDDDDALAAWLGVHNRVQPEDPETLEEMLFMTRMTEGRINLAARLGRTVVGAGSASPSKGHPGVGNVMTWIDPAFQRRGIGSALLAEGAAYLDGLGLARLHSHAHDDGGAGLAFAAAHGFGERSREQMVSLDLERFDQPAPPTPEGILITSFAERPDLLRSAYETDVEAASKIPGEMPHVPPPFEHFEQFYNAPGFVRELAVFAVAGDQVVGLATLKPSLADPTLAWHWLTGVRSDWRRRGIARALKHAQLTAARRAGVLRVRTANNVLNEPMVRLNDELGYEREPDFVNLGADTASVLGSRE